MKTTTGFFIIFFLFIISGSTAQNNKLHSNSSQSNIELTQMGALLNSKKFEFIATTMYPSGGSPKNLVGSNYSMIFSPDLIISELPFYGRGYSGSAYSKNKGMRFKGEPTEFNIGHQKEYQVNARVDDGDTYDISLSVGESGYATLIISSNNRGTITYQGEVINIE